MWWVGGRRAAGRGRRLHVPRPRGGCRDGSGKNRVGRLKPAVASFAPSVPRPLLQGVHRPRAEAAPCACWRPFPRPWNPAPFEVESGWVGSPQDLRHRSPAAVGASSSTASSRERMAGDRGTWWRGGRSSNGGDLVVAQAHGAGDRCPGHAQAGRRVSRKSRAGAGPASRSSDAPTTPLRAMLREPGRGAEAGHPNAAARWRVTAEGASRPRRSGPVTKPRGPSGRALTVAGAAEVNEGGCTPAMHQGFSPRRTPPRGL